MKQIISISCLLLFFITSVLAQHIKSNKGHENNPYYSNTDTKPLKVSNAEWKKILSPELYAVAGSRQPSAPLPVNTGTAAHTALTIARCAAMCCLNRMPSLPAIAAGQAFLSRYGKTV
jgi:hypothetical protein